MTGAIVAGMLTMMASMTPASASTRFGRAVEVSLPPDAEPLDTAILIGLGCARASFCVGGGSYENVSGHTLPFVATESAGRWAQPVALVPPSNAEFNPIAEVDSVACPGVGSCVVVGGYYDNETFVQHQSFVATQSHGLWGAGQEMNPPANTFVPSTTQTDAIACPGIGSCVTVGTYKDGSGRFQAMAATKSSGTWEPSAELRMPVGAASKPDPFFLALACPRAGSCVTAGQYTEKSGALQVALVTESGGTWQRGTELKLPAGAAANPDASLRSIACTRIGACQAVGWFKEASGSSVPMVATESNGHWGTARRLLKVPSNAAAKPFSFVVGLSCIRAGSCVAVGGYVDKAGGGVPMALTESGGRWITATQLQLPANAHAQVGFSAGLREVACLPAGCTAIGNYATKASVTRPMAATTLP